MGSGASKKTADGQVVVAVPPSPGHGKSSAEQLAAEENADAPGSPSSLPPKPKVAQEGKRPRPTRKSKGGEAHASEESSGGEPTASPTVGQSPAASPVQAARPPLPKSNSRVATAVKAQDLDDDDDDEIEEMVRPPRQPRSQQAPKPAAEQPVEDSSPRRVPQAGPASPPRPEAKRNVTPEEFVAACREGDLPMVQAFLSANSRTKGGLAEREEALFDTYGDSVLHHAVQSGNGKVVQALLELGKVQVDIPNARNETALQLACRKGDLVIVHQLIQAQADPDRRDAAGLTPFLSAVFAGSGNKLLELLSKAQATIGAQDGRGVGALHFAALRGDASLMEWLLKRKASPDSQTEHSTTPLMLAAKRGHIDGVSLLLRHKANTSLADEAGCTALMHALSGGNEEVAKKLLEDGATVNSVDCAGRTPLFHAVLGGKLDALNAVIARGGRVNVLDEEGRSPLYQACLMSAKDIALSLLDAEADPNLAGRGTTVRPAFRAEGDQAEGEATEEEDQECSAARACMEEARTCLQVCATLAHNELVKTLLDRSADMNAAPGALGWTSLHLCAAVSNDEGASVLLAKGALTNLEDAEGNTAEALAERAGHDAVLTLLKEAAASAPQVDEATPSCPAGAAPTPSAARRNVALRGPGGLGALPPLHSSSIAEELGPEEEVAPLSLYKPEWQNRESDGSLLDRTIGPMVHDAFRSDMWRLRWEALTYLSKNLSEVSGEPADIVSAVAEVVCTAARDKIAKVFLASLTVFDELLSDTRADSLGADEFAALLRGTKDQAQATTNSQSDVIFVLLDQTDAGGGSSTATSPQQVAADALCNSVLHGRVPLDEIAYPLLRRVDERLKAEAMGKEPKDRKDKALGPKQLAANLRLLGRWLSAFGLQQSGLFRRALVLPILLRAAASEHSKARAAAGEALVQLMALSGGLEDRLWQLLHSKARKAVQRLASEHEGLSLLSAVPCEEDAMKKDVIVSEDGRAGGFFCVAELTPQVWLSLQNGGEGGGNEREGTSHSKNRSAKAKKVTSCGEPVLPDPAAEALRKALTSKNWKERADGLALLAKDLSTPGGEGVRALEDGGADAGAAGSGSGGPLLSQYVLRGHRISALQAFLGTLLGDSVTQVFVGASNLLRIVCSHVPLYIAPIFLEPLLPPLVAKLLDTSGKVRGNASDTTLEIAGLHGCALSEMIAQCVASGSAWSSAPPPTGANGSASSSSRDTGDRAAGRDIQTGPRLQLLQQLVRLVQSRDADGRWTEETWQALADYAVKAAEHRSGDVRKEAAALINSLGAAGGRATEVAERAVAQLQALAQAKMVKRPGTTSTRPTTGSTRLGTAAGSRPGTGAQLGASGRLSNLGSTGGFSLNMNSTGRLSTASKTRCGTAMRPNTGANRPGTGLNRTRDLDEESDNSVHSDAPEVEAIDGLPMGNGDAAEGVQFFDVKTACPGADEVPCLEEGETALREALPLAEPLDEVALDFVAPLIALFGDGWTRCFYSRQWQCRVAALTHLSASMSHRLDALSGPEVTPNALGELLDGAMRAVHEGLGDQNVRVYAEACLAVTAVVPSFCGTVDGRLLVAHLAPLLRQLCARMGDSKEVVRLQTVQALFRLLRPPTGNIVSPIAIAMLILRHVAPGREEGDMSPNPSKGNTAGDKAARTGWLTRIGALRDLIKEHSKTMVLQPGALHPGEWLRLKDGLCHGDATVRYETARLYALVCKLHLKPLGDEEAQKPGREAWVAALPAETPPKSLQQVRKLLKLPEEPQDDLGASGMMRSGKLGASGRLGASGKLNTASIAPLGRWEVPMSLANWACCALDALDPLREPTLGNEKAVAGALRTLGKGVANFADAPKRRDGPKPDEAFAALCRAIQQALSSPVAADRGVFLTAVELCQMAVTQLAPILSGLDINMGLSKTIPILMERTSLTGMNDVKIGVASDKLVQQLAKHPKVGAEAVTKMVISAMGRSERPIRPLVLLRTLLSDFGLRLCAQRDVVMLLLGAVGSQLERIGGGRVSDVCEDSDAVRQQLVGVLATVNQFSAETVQQAMKEVDPEQRKLISGALAEAPNPRLVALGATAAEQGEMPHLAGSAVRAASRSRGLSPKPGGDEYMDSPPPRRHPLASAAGRSSRPNLPRAEDGAMMSRSSSSRHVGEASPSGGGLREASPSSRRQRRSRIDCSPQQDPGMEAASASDCAPDMSPQQSLRNGFGRASTGSLGNVGSSMDPGMSRSVRWGGGDGARPPAPMGLSTRLGGNGDAGWRYGGEDGEAPQGGPGGSRRGNLQRVGSSEGRFDKGKGKDASLGALMDVLSQMDGGTRTKTR